jgi:exonuclease III
VGIHLSPRAKQAWIKAGARKPTLSEEIAGCVRWMTITLMIEVGKTTTHKAGRKEMKITSAYHPQSGIDMELVHEYYDKLDEYLANISPHNCTHIIGADANVSLGIARDRDADKILGRHGNPHVRKDANGAETANMMKNILHKHNMRAVTTDFQHKRHDTWISVGLQKTAQIDYFFVTNNFRNAITDAKRVGTGVDSDHAAIKLTFRLVQQPKKSRDSNNKKPQKRIRWRDLAAVQSTYAKKGR